MAKFGHEERITRDLKWILQGAAQVPCSCRGWQGQGEEIPNLASVGSTRRDVIAAVEEPVTMMSSTCITITIRHVAFI